VNYLFTSMVGVGVGSYIIIIIDGRLLAHLGNAKIRPYEGNSRY
jgi:hypothetical protein